MKVIHVLYNSSNKLYDFTLRSLENNYLTGFSKLKKYLEFNFISGFTRDLTNQVFYHTFSPFFLSRYSNLTSFLDWECLTEEAS